MNQSATPPLKARHVQFQWTDTPVHWIPDDPFATHMINVLHLLLPAGELWFCRVYNKALPLVTDATLRADVQGFIRQEAVHSRSHAKLLAYYREKGLDTTQYTQMVEYLFTQLLDEKPLKQKWLGRLLGRRWVIAQVGLIAAIEHFTCVLGSWVLTAKGLENADPVMLDLLRWHGAEEVEHRHVAYDLYRHLCQSESGFYLSRQALMLVMLPILFGLWVKGARFMYRQDSATQKYAELSVMRLLREFGNTAHARDSLPTWSLLGDSLRRWVSTAYHPEHEADTQQALDYLATSPAARLAA